MEWEVPFNRYKNIIINITVVIIALLIASNIYKARSKVFDTVRENKDQEIERNKLLENMSKLDKKINSYKSFLNKKDISLVINHISSIAKSSGIQINSVKPEAEQHYPNYFRYGFNFTINARDYNALGDFISKLESSSDVYMVDNINITPEFESEGGRIKGLSVLLRIYTFLFRE